MHRMPLLAVALGAFLCGSAEAINLPGAYKSGAANAAYNKLFCDQPELYVTDQPAARPAAMSRLLAAKPADLAAVRAIAGDARVDGCTRVLAYSWLRWQRQKVPPKTVLGVVFEFPQKKGLDVVAAYLDGRVLSMDGKGKLTVFAPADPKMARQAQEVFARGQTLIAGLDPWNRQRMSPPPVGGVRISFLASDGLYFGDGGFGNMAADKVGGPAVKAALDLMALALGPKKK